MICFCFFSSRLFGDSRSSDIWSPFLPTREDEAVPDADEGTYRCSRLHCSCSCCWCLCCSPEAQRMKTCQSHTSAIIHSIYNHTPWSRTRPNLKLDLADCLNELTNVLFSTLFRYLGVKANTIYCLKSRNYSWW